MRQIILEIEDSAYEKFMGMVELCPMVKVISAAEQVEPTAGRDRCMAYAIRTLRANRVFRHSYDYAWVMLAVNEGLVDDFDAFKSPKAFISYLNEIGIEGLPDRSTLARARSNLFQSYPNWTFMDVDSPGECLRRKNVARQFLSAFGEARRGDCTKNCTK